MIYPEVKFEVGPLWRSAVGRQYMTLLWPTGPDLNDYGLLCRAIAAREGASVWGLVAPEVVSSAKDGHRRLRPPQPIASVAWISVSVPKKWDLPVYDYRPDGTVDYHRGGPVDVPSCWGSMSSPGHVAWATYSCRPIRYKHGFFTDLIIPDLAVLEGVDPNWAPFWAAGIIADALGIGRVTTTGG